MCVCVCVCMCVCVCVCVCASRSFDTLSHLQGVEWNNLKTLTGNTTAREVMASLCAAKGMATSF